MAAQQQVMGGRGGALDNPGANVPTGDSIFRRGPAGENDILLQIVYTPQAQEQGGGYVRTKQCVKLFKRSKQAGERIQARKQWARFGAAKGATGLERGISMVAIDKIEIEDPLSEEANQTGEERLIARLKATVKTKGPRREEALPDDYESYRSTSRSNSNSRYRQGGRNSPYKPRNGRGSNPRTSNPRGSARSPPGAAAFQSARKTPPKKR